MLPACAKGSTMKTASHLAFLLSQLWWSWSHLFVRVSSLVAENSLFQHRYQRWRGRRGPQRRQSLQCSGRSLEEGATIATTAPGNDERGEGCHVRAPPTMVPLSRPPLLLLRSSAPIISRHACSFLSHYFDKLKNNGCGAHRFDRGQTHMAEALLGDIHDVIDEVTNCPRHDGEALVPRYVRYNSTVSDNNLLLDPNEFGNTLLPDGLHVDTNNGKLFRHVTAILYLTDNEDRFSMDESHKVIKEQTTDDAFAAGGGTTFPLAIPIDEHVTNEDNNLLGAARRLLERNIHHTKRFDSESAASDGSTLEKAALNAFHLNGRWDNRSQFSNTHRVRVMPEAGKLIYFHNVDENGFPDPRSFHGGEELITFLPDLCADDYRNIPLNMKSILVFFKEIPIEAFRDRGREGFAREVEKSRTWTTMMYY